jgi:hypothetical protein
MSSRSLGRSCLAGTAALVALGAHAEEASRQWHALPVDGGLDAISRAAGLEPGLPGWRVLYEACRRKHGLWGEDSGSVAEPSEPAAAREGAVPLPLAPAFWRGLLRNGKTLPDDKLALAILADRRAALFYRGVAGFDEETLAALAAEGEMLRRIQRRNFDTLAAFGSRFAVRGGVVAVPGGAEAEAIWQAVVGESPRAPARFLQKLVERDLGKLAFLYDSVARLDPARQRLALGLPVTAGADAAAPLRALLAAFAGEATWWRTGRGAFARPDADAARLLRELRLSEDGRVAPPASRAFWAAVLDGEPATAEALRASPRVDVAWLAARVGGSDARRRRLRLEQIAFAQRVFGAAGEQAPLEAIEALSGLVDTRALVLALERLGSRDPAFFADVVKGARASLVFQVPEDLARAHAGFQGALGVVDRARFSGTLDTETAERLVRSLVAVPLPAVVPWERGLGGWVQNTLLPELAAAVGGGDADATLLKAMAGAFTLRAAGSAFDWEGLWYRAQPERAELRRLEGVRKRQGGRGLAGALRDCRDPAEAQRRTCAHVVAEALVSIVYASHLGEPEGPALRGADPSRRHSFGPDPWTLPVERMGPGIPWHVQGSLLGLETALARLALHPLDADALPDRVPVIDAVQRRGLALGAGLARSAELGDPDRDALAAAVGSGRRRAQALRAAGPELDAVARDAGLDPWRARALEWVLAHEREAIGSFFSLGELAYLGEPAGGRWDGWGAPDPVFAGLKLRLPPPRPLDDSSGRQPERALAEVFVDLGVRVAVHLAERGLPASLAPTLIATLLPEMFVEARPVAPDDRLALDAWVREQPADRLDDAVAALVKRGPLQPAPAPGKTE